MEEIPNSTSKKEDVSIQHTQFTPVVFQGGDSSNFDSSNPTTNPKPMNTNQYATLKTIAQGMLDVALLTENVAQLRNVLRLGVEKHPFYVPMLYFISTSISLQVLAGIFIIVIGSIRIKPKRKHSCAEYLNIAIVVLIFFITVINIVISGFAIEHTVVEEEKYLRQDYLKSLCQGMITKDKGVVEGDGTTSLKPSAHGGMDHHFLNKSLIAAEAEHGQN